MGRNNLLSTRILSSGNQVHGIYPSQDCLSHDLKVGFKANHISWPGILVPACIERCIGVIAYGY